jgi:predicted LPLAT superfamily acyltransferase
LKATEQPTEGRKWRGYTGGSFWGQWSLILLFKRSDVRLGYFLMALVVPFYMLFSCKNRRAIFSYFRKQWGFSTWKSLVKTYRNHFVFGQIILDRFAVFAKGKNRFEVEIIGNEHFSRLTNSEKGFIIAGSHIGNFEIAGYLLPSEKKAINALIYPGETKVVQKNRSGILENNNVHLIPVLNDLSHLFAVNAALQRGEIVSMPCDRNFGSAKCVECHFLNGKADFPIGAFALATHLDVEVLSVFVIKQTNKKYTVYVKPVEIEGRDLPATHREKIERYVRSFAKEMENIVRQYPEQWFNFYPFWK